MFFIVVLIVGARVLPLEMQKRVINDAIALQNVEKLFLYCGIYLLSITLAGALKIAINYIQSIIGERVMFAMRQQLYEHILTLPLSFFRKTQPGMVVSALMSELSAAGTFAGMAFASPLTNILSLLAFAIYLMWLHTSLALLTLVIYPAVSFILPFLQRKANRANKSRVDITRSASNQIAESVSGIAEIQVHAAYQQEDKKFRYYNEKLKKVRIRWSLLKFGIKTTNNYFVSLGPFLVLLYGGYLIMHGQLGLGAMVAFLSAQEKLYDPWKELIDFYQVYQDASIRYKRTMEYFDHQPEFLLEAPPVESIDDRASVEVTGLSFQTEEGKYLLRDVSFRLKPGEHMALVGFSGSGKSTLIQCIAKMYQYSKGTIMLGGKNLADISKNSLVEKMGYISQRPFIFTGSVKDNLLYADLAVREVAGDEQLAEPELDRMILALQQAGLYADVMRFGLDTIVGSDQIDIINAVINIRPNFRKTFAVQLEPYVEFYKSTDYLYHSSLIGNIIFGVAVPNGLGVEQLSKHKDFTTFLKQTGLLEPLESLGERIISETLALIGDLEDPDLLAEKSPIPTESLERTRKILARSKDKKITETDKNFLLTIALEFTPAIHTMVGLPMALRESILEGRKKFPAWAEEFFPGEFKFYNKDSYIHNQSLLNNIFMGKAKQGMPHAQEKINKAIIQLLIEEDVLEYVVYLGMQFQVGSVGDRLSGGQKQKLAIARVLLKNSSLVIMDEATSALDNASQARIQRLIDTRWRDKRTVIAVMHRLDGIDSFDKIGVMKAGRLLEVGSYQELIDKKGVFHELLFGR
ncbi:ABC transporter ATP-binding protein/permease [Desulfotalea psychrophila]|uniref:ABC transporter ATP-binding protein/permease n=1 Tax=Desulfotalea psychrophila TaxID=84980 RepID=UPI0002FECA9F|nr:ABC transporter ATP-binding protein/permease [Desulfotalea psychrophila]